MIMMRTQISCCVCRTPPYWDPQLLRAGAHAGGEAFGAGAGQVAVARAEAHAQAHIGPRPTVSPRAYSRGCPARRRRPPRRWRLILSATLCDHGVTSARSDWRRAWRSSQALSLRSHGSPFSVRRLAPYLGPASFAGEGAAVCLRPLSICTVVRASSQSWRSTGGREQARVLLQEVRQGSRGLHGAGDDEKLCRRGGQVLDGWNDR